MWDPLRPKYPKKYKKPNVWRVRKNNIRKRLGRDTLRMCAKKQCLSLKNGVDIGL